MTGADLSDLEAKAVERAKELLREGGTEEQVEERIRQEYGSDVDLVVVLNRAVLELRREG